MYNALHNKGAEVECKLGIQISFRSLDFVHTINHITLMRIMTITWFEHSNNFLQGVEPGRI